MTSFRCHAVLDAVLLLAAMAPRAIGQERVLTSGNRPHLDASFSPDGRWVAYQAQGDLFVRSLAGGSEFKAYSAGQAMTYLWENNSASLVIFSLDKLLQVSRDGQTKRTIRDMKGQGVQDIYVLTPDGVWVYGVRRTTQQKWIVFRIRLSDGRFEELVNTVPGVTSLDVDRAGKKLLITATVFLFTYNFFQADLDGKNLSVINGTALSTPADHGRWLDGTKTLMLEHLGMVGTTVSGFQVWTMEAANGNVRPLTWLPRQRKAVPALSNDGKWIATLEHRPGTGTARALVLPAEGGGEVILSQPLFFTGDRIRWAPNGMSVIYVGAVDNKKMADVRVYDFDRLLRLAPTARPGKSGQVTLPLTKGEAGLVFLGFGAATPPLKVPGFTGALEIDPAKGLLALYTGAFTDLTGPWLTPNDANLVGLTVYLQGVRVRVGQGLTGDFLPLTHVDIAPN